MSTSDQPSEEELRAAYEAEVKKIRIEQIVLEQIISLVNIGMRRTGLQPGTEDERDPAQVRMAIEAVRALLPLIDEAAPPQANAIREALSQMQMAYVRIGGSPAHAGAADTPGGAGAAEPGGDPAQAGQRPAAPGAPGAPGGSGQTGPAPESPQSGEAGPAQRSGRLWIPGQ